MSGARTSNQDLFGRILTSLHACAFDDAKWPTTSGLVDQLCGSKGNFLAFADGTEQDDVRVSFARFCFRGQRDQDLERKYFHVYHALDERLPRLRRLPDCRLTHSRDLLSESERRNSVVYNELMRNTGTQDSLNVRLDGPDSSRVVWTFGDPADDDGWSHRRIEAIKRLLPHLRQHAYVRHALAHAQALGLSTARLLDNVRIGVIQFDQRRQIVHANDRARALLRKGDVISQAGRVLRAAQRKDDADLQCLLARAMPARGACGKGGSMSLGRLDSPTPLLLRITPVNEDAELLDWCRLGAIMLLLDPSPRTGLDPDRLGTLLGLTPPESRIAALLAEGWTVREIAAKRSRTEASVRWHLKNVFARHGLSRQVELVQLVRAAGDLIPEERC